MVSASNAMKILRSNGHTTKRLDCTIPLATKARNRTAKALLSISSFGVLLPLTQYGLELEDDRYENSHIRNDRQPTYRTLDDSDPCYAHNAN
jgi:hypothetical protein